MIPIPWWAGLLGSAPYFVGPATIAIIGPPRPTLREYQPLAKEAEPKVSIILPARNEAANIERCIRSILSSQYEHFELIVVDDRSEDDTAAIAERVAKEDERVRVFRGAELPRGWFGKPWACWQGFQHASGRILLFTDADTVHGPELLPRAVGALETERRDMMTVMPLQRMVTFWERAVQPFFFLLLGMRFGTLSMLNKNRNPLHAIANGQFILVTRDSYEWVGGHKKVRGTVIEDLMLAKKYLQDGKQILYAMADKDMTVRMYDSLPAIVEGWSKNFFMGVLETTHSKVLAYAGAVGTLWLPIAYLAPIICIFTAIPLALAGVNGGAALLAFGAASFVGAVAGIAMLMRQARVPRRYALLHPAGAVIQAYIIMRAIVRGTRKIVWKGRTYSHTTLP